MTKQLQAEIKTIVDQLVTHYKPEKIILFGSGARGEATDESDLDLLIIKKGVDKDSRIKRAQEAYKKFNSKVPVDILVYSPYEIKKRLYLTDPFIKTVVTQGKVLYGS